MCGRFTLSTSAKTIADMFSGLQVPEIPPSYNIAPTHQVASIRNQTERQFAWLHWGLLPSWAKQKKMAAKMINARCETVHEKPAYRSAFKKRRCLVLADGFYEWISTPDGKQPMYITLKNNLPFAMAGLWESNRKIDDQPIESCTVVTTNANSLMAPIHDRMPVILPDDLWEAWLDPAFEDTTALQKMLQPFDSDQLQATAVSKSANKVSNNSPECIKPADQQGELF